MHQHMEYTTIILTTIISKIVMLVGLGRQTIILPATVMFILQRAQALMDQYQQQKLNSLIVILPAIQAVVKMHI